MATQIPQFLINFKVYLGGKESVGVADVELPKMEFQTEEVSGAGIMGTMEVPVVGHIKPMSATIKFRTVTGDISVFAVSGKKELDFRSAEQSSDSNGVVVVPSRYTIRGSTKGMDLGKLAVGKATDTGIELAVIYVKIYRDGKEVLEVDQENGVYRVNGKDDEKVASVRAALGQ